MSANDTLGMLPTGNISSADIIAYATVSDVAPGQVRITGFADGTGATADAQEHAITKKGIDRGFAVGVVYRVARVTLTLLPSSPFLQVVKNAIAVMRDQVKSPEWTLEVTYPATNMRAAFRQGALVSDIPFPTAGEVQENVDVILEFSEYDVSF